MENLVNVLIVVIPLQTILYVVFLWSFFMFNIQDTKTTSKKITYKDFPVESPSQFSAIRTVKYGMLSLLSIFMLNVPVVVSTAQVY